MEMSVPCLENLFVLMTATAIFLQGEDYRTGKPVPGAEEACSLQAPGKPRALVASCLPAHLHSEQRYVLYIAMLLTAREALLNAPPPFRK